MAPKKGVSKVKKAVKKSTTKKVAKKSTTKTGEKYLENMARQVYKEAGLSGKKLEERVEQRVKQTVCERCCTSFNKYNGGREVAWYALPCVPTKTDNVFSVCEKCRRYPDVAEAIIGHQITHYGNSCWNCVE